MTPNKNTHSQASAPDGGEAEYDFYVDEDGDIFHVMNITDNGILVRWYRDDGRHWIDHDFFAKARPIRTRSNAKAGDVESLVSKWLYMSQACTSDEIGSTQAAVFHHCAHELRVALSTHNKTKA